MTLVFVAITMVLLLGIAALAVDIGYAFVVRGELQNAADSAALAGAQVLYVNSGTAVNPAANAEAIDYATRHRSELETVEVESVTRGHWSFGLGDLPRGFTENENVLEPPELWNVSTEELDGDPNFINAVKVVTRRRADAAPFFASILGQTAPFVRTTAVAYIGFAGSLAPWEVDNPIAICNRSLWINDEYTCSIGQMLSSSPAISANNTAAWTNFTQPSPCQGASPQGEVSARVCSGNPAVVLYGVGMQTTGGTVTPAYNAVRDCFLGRSDPNEPLNMTLPVIECDSNNAGDGGCKRVVGAVNVDVVWATSTQNTLAQDAQFPPARMADWVAPTPAQIQALRVSHPEWVAPNGQPLSDKGITWNYFADHFHLLMPDGSPATFEGHAIYFLPNCEPHEPSGTTGGENYGVLARIPVLVNRPGE